MHSRPVIPSEAPETAAELRRRAQRARDLAASLIGDEAEQRLLKLAEQYEHRAALLEATREAPQP